MVIASALHAEGRWFEPGRKQMVVFFFLWHYTLVARNIRVWDGEIKRLSAISKWLNVFFVSNVSFQIKSTLRPGSLVWVLTCLGTENRRSVCNYKCYLCDVKYRIYSNKNRPRISAASGAKTLISAALEKAPHPRCGDSDIKIDRTL